MHPRRGNALTGEAAAVVANAAVVVGGAAAGGVTVGGVVAGGAAAATAGRTLVGGNAYAGSTFCWRIVGLLVVGADRDGSRVVVLCRTRVSWSRRSHGLCVVRVRSRSRRGRRCRSVGA